MRAATSMLAALVLSACDARIEDEDWRDWYDAGSGYDIQEPVAFTDEPLDFPADAADGIQAMREELLTQTFDNAGPFFPHDDDNAIIDDCAFWERLAAPGDGEIGLPREIEGIVTSHPRVYRKIEGCDGDERYYGSYWLADRTGGIFVLNDSKVAHFDMGDRVRLRVRSVRRRFGLDMVYVQEAIEIDRGPYPIPYREVTAPLRQTDQSTTVRATGVVVSEPTTFGETLVQIDGYTGGTCSDEDEVTRSHCLVVTLDQEINRRGITLQQGERLRVTGPVSQSAYFGPTGVFNFYGIYITRVGQIERLDAE